MGQVSRFLRRGTTFYAHWCPGCEETHAIYDSWSFDGNLERPTFNPSVKITGKQSIVVNGKWTGELKRGPDGKALDGCCHYHLHDGQIKFCGDCTHALNGQTVPLPPLPEFLTDDGDV